MAEKAGISAYPRISGAVVLGLVGLLAGSIGAATVPAHAATTAPSAPGVSGGTGVQIVVDNDFALLMGNDTNVTRLLYNNNVGWPAQAAAAATVEVVPEAGETYLYVVTMGGGGTEDWGGRIGGLDITGIAGAQRATDAAATWGYRQIQGSLAGYNLAQVAAGTYNVALGDAQTGLAGATWGSAVADGIGDGVPPKYKTGGVGAGPTGRAWGFPNSTAVAFRYPISALSLPPVAGDRQVQVFWATPASDGGAPITDYVVQYRTTAGPGAWQTINDGISTATNTIVTGLTNGTSYDFQIAAVNEVGQSAFSTTVSATPESVPSEPLNLAGELSGTQAVLTWVAPSSDGGRDITDYVVQYRTTAGPGEWQTFADGVAPVTTATVTGLTNGTSYDFRVAAVNAVGTGPYTTPIKPVWDATAPGSPRDLVASSGDGVAGLTWSPPNSDGGTPITGYVVEYRTGTGAWTRFTDGTSTATNADVTGLDNGVTYEFRVAAVNANGEGPFSTVVTAVPTGVIAAERDQLSLGAINPSVIITSTATFAAAIGVAEFNIDSGATGLTLSAVVRNSGSEVTLRFTGEVQAGTISIQALASAFDPVASSPSNTVLFVIRANNRPPPPWLQAYQRPSADAPCEEGWHPSWADWPNDGSGGFTCERRYQYINERWFELPGFPD